MSCAIRLCSSRTATGSSRALGMPPKAPGGKPAKAAKKAADHAAPEQGYWALSNFRCDEDGVPLVRLPASAEQELGLIMLDGSQHYRPGKRGAKVPTEVWATHDGFSAAECPYDGAALYYAAPGIKQHIWIDTADDLMSYVKCVCHRCALFARVIRHPCLAHGPTHRSVAPRRPPGGRCMLLATLCFLPVHDVHNA